MSPGEFEMNERSNAVDLRNDRFDGWRAITMAFDLNIVRAHIPHRRHILCIGMFRRFDLQVANTRTSFMDASMKEVYIAEKMIHKRRGRMIVDFLRRADLLDL